MAWDPDNLLPDTTGTILIGSSTGDVYEVVVEDRKEKRFNAVYRMAEQKAITGLRYDRCPPGSPGALFVLAATACPTRYVRYVNLEASRPSHRTVRTAGATSSLEALISWSCLVP